MNNIMSNIVWDVNAAKAFARHKLDMERNFEKEDPTVNISSITELLNY